MTLVELIQAHGHKAHLSSTGEIIAIERYTLNGVPGSQAVRIEATRRAVRAWLGY